jgi:hypothetical protein
MSSWQCVIFRKFEIIIFVKLTFGILEVDMTTLYQGKASCLSHEYRQQSFSALESAAEDKLVDMSTYVEVTLIHLSLN